MPSSSTTESPARYDPAGDHYIEQARRGLEAGLTYEGPLAALVEPDVLSGLEFLAGHVGVEWEVWIVPVAIWAAWSERRRRDYAYEAPGAGLRVMVRHKRVQT